jgi:predicted ATPase
MITRIEAYRYRCFSEQGVNVRFGEYNIIAGRNGAGKTTLLDIPNLLGDIIRSRYVADAFLEPQASWETARAHTLAELFFKESSDVLTFTVEAKLPPEIINQLTATWVDADRQHEDLWPKFIRYELRLELFNGEELQVRDERLFLFPDRHPVKPEGRYEGLMGSPTKVRKESPPEMPHESWLSILHRGDGAAAIFSQEIEEPIGKTKRPIIQMRAPAGQSVMAILPPDNRLFPASNWFRNLLERDAVYFDPKWNTLRQASPSGYGLRMRTSGATMAWLALDLQENAPERFESWIKHVQTGLRHIRSIRAVEREEDHHAYFAVTYDNGYTVTSSGLSEGTLRLIALTLIPYLRIDVLPKHLVIEQPEDGIHPQAIETILDSLSSVYDSQVWVSTQSPLVLALSNVKHVICASIAKDSSAQMINGADHPRLKDWKGTIDLGTLLAAGVLG